MLTLTHHNTGGRSDVPRSPRSGGRPIEGRAGNRTRRARRL